MQSLFIRHAHVDLRQSRSSFHGHLSTEDVCMSVNLHMAKLMSLTGFHFPPIKADSIDHGDAGPTDPELDNAGQAKTELRRSLLFIFNGLFGTDFFHKIYIFLISKSVRLGRPGPAPSV